MYIKRIATITSVVTISLVTSQLLVGQSRHQEEGPSTQQAVESLSARPDLGVDYARVAKFKLASRKALYRVGEMISLDLAVMNVSTEPVFFHELNRPTLEFKAQNEKKASVPINTFYTVLEGTAPTSYKQIEAGYFLSNSFELLAGCDDAGLRTFNRAKKQLEEQERVGGEAALFKGLFERDLFVNWGEACFAIEKPGKYTITAEQSNDTVIVLPRGPKVKTAVGTIRSTELVITITE